MSTNTIPSANSHSISLTTATAMTDRYRLNRESVLDSTKRNQDILPISETYNRVDVENLLAMEGCEALRIYYGMDSDLKLRSILVPVNGYNEDMIPSVNSFNSEDDIILDLAQRCPELCGPSSPLNS